MNRLLHSSWFWFPCVTSLIVIGAFFAWELDFLNALLPSLPRPPATGEEIIFSTTLGLLLSLTIGMFVWHWKEGSCPIGMKRATGMAGVIGAVTLICPVCIVLPASLIGVAVAVSAIAPFLPVLRLIAIGLLLICMWMMKPDRVRDRVGVRIS